MKHQIMTVMLDAFLIINALPLSFCKNAFMVTGRPTIQHTSRRRPRPDFVARADRAYRQPANMQPDAFCYHEAVANY